MNSIDMIERHWANLFYPPMGLDEADVRQEALASRRLRVAHAADPAAQRRELGEQLSFDTYTCPFVLIVDGTITASNWETDGWKQGPLPLQFMNNDSAIDRWWSDEQAKTVPFTLSDENTRAKHFSPRVEQHVYRTGADGTATADPQAQRTGRWHRILKAPVDLAGPDMQMQVEGVTLWAVEILQATPLAEEPDGFAACEVMLHLEVSTQGVPGGREELFRRLTGALTALTRSAGPETAEVYAYDPLTGKPSKEQIASPGTARAPASGRSTFLKRLEQLVVQQGWFASNQLFMRAFIGDAHEAAALIHKTPLTAKDQARLDVLGTIRRCFSVVPFAYRDSDTHVKLTEKVEALAAPLSTGDDEAALRRVRVASLHTSLITGSLQPSERSVARGLKLKDDATRALVLQDGVSFVFDSPSNPYNLPGLAYCLGIYMDQFALSRLCTRLIEQIGMSLSALPPINSREIDKEGALPREQLDVLSRKLASIDADLTQFMASYWQPTPASSSRARALLTNYRAQHSDDEALEVAVNKREELGRVIASQLAIRENLDTRATKRLVAGVSFIAVPLSLTLDAASGLGATPTVMFPLIVAVLVLGISLFIQVDRKVPNFEGM